MKVNILPTALEDLDRGRRFYARQRRSLGDYFLDALFSDIDSLELYAGIHMKVFDFHRLLAKTTTISAPRRAGVWRSAPFLAAASGDTLACFPARARKPKFWYQ